MIWYTPDISGWSAYCFKCVPSCWDSNKHASHTSRGSRIVVFQCVSTFSTVFVVLSSKILKQMPKANSDQHFLVLQLIVQKSGDHQRWTTHLSIVGETTYWNTCSISETQIDWWLRCCLLPTQLKKKHVFQCFSLFLEAHSMISQKSHVGRVSRVEPFQTCLNNPEHWRWSRAYVTSHSPGATDSKCWVVTWTTCQTRMWPGYPFGTKNFELPSLKLTAKALEIDGWKISQFPFLGFRPIFSGDIRSFSRVAHHPVLFQYPGGWRSNHVLSPTGHGKNEQKPRPLPKNHPLSN